MTARPPAMSEADLQTQVIQTALWHRLLVHHCRPGMTRDGRWATQISGTPGFPDLVIAGPGGVAFVELKSGKGRLSADQKQWLNDLAEAGMETHVWRPDDFPHRVTPVLERLAGKKAA